MSESESESKDVKALRVLRLQGVEKSFSDTRKILCKMIRGMGIPEKEVAILDEIIRTLSCPDGVVEFKEMFAPAYTKRFSEEELDGIITILSDPLFQKYQRSQADIAAETLEKTMEWAQEKITKVLEKYSSDPGDVFEDPPWQED